MARRCAGCIGIAGEALDARIRATVVLAELIGQASDYLCRFSVSGPCHVITEQENVKSRTKRRQAENGNKLVEYWRGFLPDESLPLSSGQRKVAQADWIIAGVALVVAVVWGIFFLN